MLVGVPQDYFCLEELPWWRFAGAPCWLPLSLTVMCHIIKPGGNTRVSHHAHRNIQKGSARAEWRISGFLSAGISEDTWGILWHHIIAVTSRQMPLTEWRVIIFLHSFPTHITSQFTSSLVSCSLSRNQPDRDFKKWKYNYNLLYLGCVFAMLPLTLEPAITGRRLLAKKNLNKIKINNSSKKTAIMYQGVSTKGES